MTSSTSPDLLEWLGLLVDVLTPLVLGILGWRAHAYVDRLTRLRGLAEVESAWRLEVFRDLVGNLNSIFCYFTYQGDWKSMSPEDATEAKWAADRLVHMNRFLWSKEFLEAYDAFRGVAFVENQGRGRMFALRANVARHREENRNWQDAWGERFVAESERVTREEFVAAYDKMLHLAVSDLGIHGADP